MSSASCKKWRKKHGYMGKFYQEFEEFNVEVVLKVKNGKGKVTTCVLAGDIDSKTFNKAEKGDEVKASLRKQRQKLKTKGLKDVTNRKTTDDDDRTTGP